MLVHALHAALKDAEISLNRILKKLAKDIAEKLK
jgi:hypothetical protein